MPFASILGTFPTRVVLMTTILGLGSAVSSPCWAEPAEVCPTCRRPFTIHNHAHRPGPGAGTLGYGPPGPQPGFQGFGLGFHPGHGYGGAGLGVGADGGYPFYGGPGYVHPAPQLNRLGKNVPFAHDPGPGGPVPGHPNYYAPTGPLAPDNPVVQVVSDPNDPVYNGDYGCFTGMIPYAETLFAPYVTNAAVTGSSVTPANCANSTSDPTTPNSPPSPSPAPPDPSVAPTSAVVSQADPIQIPTLGVEVQPHLDSDNSRSLRILRVRPVSPAAQTGLHAGDLIRSINGYVAETAEHLSWIVSHATDKVLLIQVRNTVDGELRTSRMQIP